MADDIITPAPEVPADNVEVITDWRDSLPDTLRDNPSLADVKDIGALAQRYVDTKAMVGNSVRIPTDEAGDEAISAFASRVLEHQNLGLMKKPDLENAESMADVYNSLGRPEDAGGYVAPEGVDAEAFGALAGTAHELGMSKKQFEAISQKHNELTQNQIGAMVKERDAGLAQLQGEWGLAYNEKVERAASIVKQLGGHAGIEGALAGNNVDAPTLRLLDTIATQLGAEGSPMANQVNNVSQPTTDELRQKRNEVTQRLIKENLTPREQKDLQDRLVSLSEQILAVNG